MVLESPLCRRRAVEPPGTLMLLVTKTLVCAFATRLETLTDPIEGETLGMEFLILKTPRALNRFPLVTTLDRKGSARTTCPTK